MPQDGYRVIFSLIFCSLPLLLIGCTTPSVGTAREHGQTFVFECEQDYRFVARIEGETAWLFLPGETHRLPHVVSASGSKYQEDSWLFWNKGEQALLETEQATYSACVNNRRLAIWEDAKLRGVDFRAIGNEPGWVLEISQQNRLLLRYDYGERLLEVEMAGPLTDPLRRQSLYRADSDQGALQLTLEARECFDSMSGERFETSVSVTLGEKYLQGCGKPLH